MLPQNPEFYQALLDRVTDGICLVDRRGKITLWNEGAARLTGYSAEESIGRGSWKEILCGVDLEGNDLNSNGASPASAIAQKGKFEGRVFLRHKEGRRIPVALRAQPLFDIAGQEVGEIEIFCAVALQAEARQESEDMLDHLTLLPNRRFIEISLERVKSEFAPPKSPFGVLSIDMDRFKEINNTWGRAAGDTVLKETAQTLVGALRSTDVVGRWGGDKFLAIVHNVDDDLLNGLARRCVSRVGQMPVPITTIGRSVSRSISVGAALATAGESTEDLLKRANEALRQSKTDWRASASGFRSVLRETSDTGATPHVSLSYPLKTASS
jgi:diguanylate cyclase (GGDEF)-like protein/PAS domain S-box-containing protein